MLVALKGRDGADVLDAICELFRPYARNLAWKAHHSEPSFEGHQGHVRVERH